jgi:hypothetical protein
MVIGAFLTLIIADLGLRIADFLLPRRVAGPLL